MWKYEYMCVAVKVAPQCSSHTTNDDSAGNWDFAFLDRHEVRCPVNTFLSAFELQQGSTATRMQYSYECCGLDTSTAANRVTGK